LYASVIRSSGFVDREPTRVRAEMGDFSLRLGCPI
jgi:hypothetical protein